MVKSQSQPTPCTCSRRALRSGWLVLSTLIAAFSMFLVCLWMWRPAVRASTEPTVAPVLSVLPIVPTSVSIDRGMAASQTESDYASRWSLVTFSDTESALTGSALSVDRQLYAAWSSRDADVTRSVAWGDMDGDGDLDLAAGNFILVARGSLIEGSANKVYRNDAGVLQETAVWTSIDLDLTSSVAWGDMDGDGDLDLAVGNYDAPNKVYRNEGGMLQTTAVFTSTDNDDTSSVAWGDMDGDGDLDLAVGNSSSANKVYRNEGGMLHTTAVFTSTDNDATSSVAWGDMDGDGDLDLAVGNYDAPNKVYRNEGGMLQTTAVITSTDADATSSVAWGDMDGDGDLDLAVGNSGSANKVYRNEGGMLHTTAVFTSTDNDDTSSVAWGDVDGDGDLDLAAGNIVLFGRGSPSKVYQNDGGVLQAAAVWISTVADATYSVAWGDMDGDGDLDLAAGSSHSADVGSSNKVYRNDGSVLEETDPWVSADDDLTSEVAWGDMDGDGDLDLAAGNSDGPNKVYRNDGGVLHVEEVWTSTDADATYSIAWGDMDGDGDLDLAVGNSGSPNQVYRNDDGVLQATAVWTSNDADATSSIAWGDMDDDGDLDLAAGNSGSANKVYRNDGGVLQETAVWISADEDRTFSVAWGDMDGDGDLDLAAGNYRGPNKVYENDGGVLRATSIWSSTDDDDTYSVAWGDMEGDGDLDLAAGNSGSAFSSFGSSNKVYTNDGGVLYATATWISSDDDLTGDVAWVDIDGDGDLDLAAGNYGGSNKIYRNDRGILQEAAAWTSTNEDSTSSVALGDVDGDGDLDLAVGNSGGALDHSSRSYKIYLNSIYGVVGLVNHPSQITVGRPAAFDGVPNTSVVSEVLTSRYITIPYRLFDPEGEEVGMIKGYYSLDGGGRWLPAKVARDSTTQTLARDTGRWIVAAYLTPTLDILAGPAGTLTATLVIADRAILSQVVDVWVAITHTCNSDLSIALESPGGTRMPLLASGDAAGQDLRGTHFSSNLTAAPIVSGAAPYTGTYRAAGDLGRVNGEEANGTWKLVISNAGTVSGTLVSWGLRLRTPPATHYFVWDTAASGVFGQSDNAVVRLIATGQPLSSTVPVSGTYLYTNTTAGPYQRPYASATTLPFRVRGMQVQVYSGTIAAANVVPNALVYQLPAQQTRNAQTSADLAGRAYRTDGQGYLQGRGHLAEGDGLMALWPTDQIADSTPTKRYAAAGQALPIDLPPSTDGSTPGGMIASAIAVSDALRIGDIAVSANISSSQPADLHIRLIPPWGTPVNLISGTLDLTGTVALLIPEEFRRGSREGERVLIAPELSSLRGQMAEGNWILQVENRGSTTVTLNSWGLNLTLSQLYYTSDAATMYTVTTDTDELVQSLTVSSAHPLQLFDMVVSLEWDARNDATFREQLEADLKRTSEILYDWTNGQAALGVITIYYNGEHWDDAHIRILASNRQRPNADLGGYVTELLTETVEMTGTDILLTETVEVTGTDVFTYTPGQIRMPVMWNRFGDAAEGSLSEDWPRGLAHELGHYLFFLHDNYLGLENEQLVFVSGCPGVMSDPYRDSDGDGYDEFNAAPNWPYNKDCEKTLSHQLLRRSDWQTMIRHYPWMIQPTEAITASGFPTGPSLLPLAVTQIQFADHAPKQQSGALEAPFFSLIDSAENVPYMPSSQARAFLFGNDRLTDLGGPVGDQLKAWGATPGQRLCVFDVLYSSCVPVGTGNTELAMIKQDGWHPDVVIRPVSETTLALTVTTGIDAGEFLTATLYPVDSRSADAVETTRLLRSSVAGITTYTGVFSLITPTLEAYVHVTSDGIVGDGPYEVVTDIAIGGAPGSRYASNYGGSRAGRGRPRFGRRGAPVLSRDGQTLLYGKNIESSEGQLHALQTATIIPDPPSWVTPVGQAYRIVVSDNITRFEGATLSISYLDADVPVGEEKYLAIYYYAGQAPCPNPEDVRWCRLTSQPDLNTNTVTALVDATGPGLYVLMSSLEIPLTGPGWNLVGYPLTIGKPVAEALQSINGKYTTLYAYHASDEEDPWKLYDADAPSWVNDLNELRFAEGYLINVSATAPISAPIVLRLTGGFEDAATLTETEAIDAGTLANLRLRLPPATYYGEVVATSDFQPQQDMLVLARVGDKICGIGRTQDEGGAILYSVKVRSASQDSMGCGLPSRKVVFEVGSRLVAAVAEWNNERVNQLSLVPAPMTTGIFVTVQHEESWQTIGLQFGLPWQLLWSTNPEFRRSHRELRVGDRLFVPLWLR